LSSAMGKLNIAHHKSYHPYRRDNIERVRKDEEEARRKEENEDGRMMLADSEARIDLLREKSGVLDKKEKKKKRRDDDDLKDLAANSSTRGPVLPTSNGHINLFEDLEQSALMAAIKATKKVSLAETEMGVPLAPLAKDLKPWYSERTREQPAEEEAGHDEKRKRDESRKYVHDPLTSITKQLAARPSASMSSSSYRPPLPSKASHDMPSEVQARLSRESTERGRALELIRRKRHEMEGNATPSTVFSDSGYGDVYNKREVQEAHRFRDRRWDSGRRHWDDDDRHKRRPSKLC